ncbi:MAG: hypothetical protein L0Z62_41060 [Gemmataceae bacterium]|nr:hypothetical protein [Gemmataceae bacterium]
MNIPILIEPLAEGRFRAQTGPPWGLSADGATASEAKQHLAELIQARLAGGAQLAVRTIPNSVAGVTGPPFPADDLYKTDWVYRELQEAIAENRRLEEAADS